MRKQLFVSLLLALLISLPAMAGNLIALQYAGKPLAEGLNFTYTIGDPLPGAVSGTVSSIKGSVDFTISTSATWIVVSPTSGTTPKPISVGVNPAGLGKGTYTGSITVRMSYTENGQPVDAYDVSTITLTVFEKPAVPVSLNPATLSFVGDAGKPLTAKSLALASSSATSIPFTVKSDQNWLGATSGVVNGAASVVTVSASSLAPGSYSANLSVSVPGGDPNAFVVPVSLTLTKVWDKLGTAPPSQMTFDVVKGGALAPGQSFRVTEASGANTPFSFSSVQPLPSWLSITPSSGTAPQSFTVGVNHAGLNAGTYTYDAIYSYPNTQESFYTTRITLTVKEPPQPTVSVSPQSLSFTSSAGATSNPSPASVNVSALAGATDVNAPVSVTSAPAWLQAQVSGSTPASVTVTPNLIGQPAGTLSGTIVLAIATQPASTSVTVPVSAIVSSANLQVSPNSISIVGTAGQAPSGPQASISLTTSSGSPISFSIAPSGTAAWLGIDATSGATPLIVNVTANAASLAAGTQTATLNVTVAGQVVATVPVTFNVAAALPPLTVSKNSLSFTAFAGGAATAAQSFDLVTNSQAMQAFTVAASDAWIVVTPASGQGSSTIAAHVDPKNLAPGKYAGTAVVTAGNATQSVNVSVDVVAPNAPSFGADTNGLTFTKPQGMPGVLKQTVALANLPASVAGNGLIQWTVSPATTGGGQWLSATAINTAALPFSFDVYVDNTGLAQGTYSGQIQVSAVAGTTSSISVPVTFTVTAPVINSYTPSPAQIDASGKQSYTVVLSPASSGLSYTAAAAGGTWLTLAPGTASGSMPATLTLSVDPAGIAPGVYHASITVTATAAQGVQITAPTQVIPITLTVQAPPPPNLQPAPINNGQFTGLFVVDRNYPAANRTSQPLVSVSNLGSGLVPVSVTSSTSWLEFDRNTFSVGTDAVQVAAHIRSDAIPAATGTFGGSYTLSTENGVFYNGVVTLQVGASAPSFEVRPVAASVTATAGYSQPLASVATIVNTGSTPISYTITTAASWLSLSSASGTLAVGEAKDFTVTAGTGLNAGTYQATVTIGASVGSATVQKTFDIAASIQPQAPAAPPDVTPAGIVTTAANGQYSQQFTILNPGSTALNYLVTSSPYTTAVEQLQCDVAGNCASQSVIATYPTAAVTISSPSGSVSAGDSQVINIQGAMAGSPVASYINFSVGGSTFVRLLKVDPVSAGSDKSLGAASCTASTMVAVITNLSANSTVSAGLPTAIQAKFTDGCGAPLSKGTVFAQFSNGDAKVSLQPASTPGIWTGTWVPVNVDAPEVVIVLTALNQNLTGTRIRQSVLIRKLAGIPVLPPGSVVSAADFGTPMATAPGSYISIFGTSLGAADTVPPAGTPATTPLGGTQVTLGGRVLPLSFVSAQQINAFIPYDIVPGSTLPLQVIRANGSSVSQPLVVGTRQPAMFLKDSSAARPGVVVVYRGAQSFVVDASHPASAGDIVVLYSVGLGPVDQDLAPSKVAPVNPLTSVKGSVKVTIGGKDAQVLFAGLSPTSLGLYQVNARMPAGVGAGNQVPVVVTVEGQSTSLVTIPVR